MQAAVNAKQQKYVDAAFEKELAKLAEEGQRAALRDAFRTPAAKRNAEQKRLLAANPNLNISGGLLYQYNQAAATRSRSCRPKWPPNGAEAGRGIPGRGERGAGPGAGERVFHRGDYRQPKGQFSPAT